jgi:hypothetical protein
VSKAVFAVALILSALTSSVALARGGGGGNGGGGGHFMTSGLERGAPPIFKHEVRPPTPSVTRLRINPRRFVERRVITPRRFGEMRFRHRRTTRKQLII